MNENSSYKGPYLRPWMRECGCAAVASGSNLKPIIAGAITGGTEVSISYPIEYVKTQLQLDQRGGTKRYSGVVDCIRKTFQSHGIFGFYRGFTVLLYGSIPKSAARFGAFEALKKRTLDEQGNLPPRMRVLCGMGAGICEALFVVTPMETIKVKFINDQISGNPRFKGFFQGVSLILKEDGLRGVYQGGAATVMKQGSNQAIRFFVMETGKDWYRGGDATKPVPKLMIGVFGALAGATSVFGNAPLDVVKTRMQGLEASRYSGTFDCFVKIWKNEGPTAFYKGTVPRLSRICLGVAITFMIFDAIMDLFNKVWPPGAGQL